MNYKTMRCVWFGVMLFFQFVFINFTFSQKILTIEDFVTLRYPTHLSCAPNGSELACEIRSADLQTNRYQRHIWHVTVAPFSMKSLFAQFEQSFQPQWCPAASNLLAFLAIPASDSASAGGNTRPATQLYLFNLNDPEPTAISQAPLGVKNFVWSPNGKTLAYFTQQPDDLKNLRESQQRGFDAINYDTPQFPHAIWLFDLQTRINEKIYTGDFGIREIAFSPDGEMLVFSTNYSGLAADANFDLWILSPGSRQAFPFTQFPGEETNPQFSPDGQQIAFLGSLDALFKFPQTDLFLAPLSGGPLQNLTAAFDFPVTEFLWHGTRLCFLAQEKTGQHPFEIDLPSGKIKPLLKKNPGDWFSELTGAAPNKPLFLLGESATRLPEIFRLDAAGEFTAISHFSDTLKMFQIRLPEKITWSAPGGKVIEGWFYKPLAGAPPYPTIVALHGGPFSAFRNLLVQNEYLQLYAQHGYAVFAPNPSGSSGYGDAFAREIINQIGKLDSPQILAGLEHLIAQGLVDSNRVGIVGGSYGGYLVNWIISQTNRFRAAVSLYGIFDLTHDWGSSSQPIWQRIYLSEYYWQNSNRYRELSPATFVTQIRTPLLLLHGENDLITDLSNSKQAFRALKTLGRDVELVIYPRENHGIQREPNHEIDKIRRILGWFDRHLR